MKKAPDRYIYSITTWLHVPELLDQELGWGCSRSHYGLSGDNSPWLSCLGMNCSMAIHEIEDFEEEISLVVLAENPRCCKFKTDPQPLHEIVGPR